MCLYGHANKARCCRCCPLKAKSFRNTATYKKTLGRGFHDPPPPHRLVKRWHGGMNLRVHLRVKN